jgi:hypothetical protein
VILGASDTTLKGTCSWPPEDDGMRIERKENTTATKEERPWVNALFICAS